MSMGQEWLDDMMIFDMEREFYLQDKLASRVWVCENGKETHISKLSRDHLVNCIKHIVRGGPDSVHGYGNEWLPVLRDELRKRPTLAETLKKLPEVKGSEPNLFTK